MTPEEIAYRKRQARCRCLTPTRHAFIQFSMNFAHDFSDGAFMAYMEECGIDASELEPFATDHDCANKEGTCSKG